MTNLTLANIIKAYLAKVKKGENDMKYPFKYPTLYGELAMQGKTKKELAETLHITMAGLRYKQSMETDGDFRGDEMRIAAAYLGKPLEYLFTINNGEERVG